MEKEKIGLGKMIQMVMFEKDSFTLKEAYAAIPDKPATTIRGRIYDNLGILFEKVSKGVYRSIDKNCVLIEGDGRDLSMIEDNSIDCIITDHPWDDKSTKGGNRNFANTFDCFNYTLEDFKEKARVLKDGAFLVELIPAESETNFDYLYSIKKMAEKAGFQYYAKVPWIKGDFVSNTGRKSKNSEDLMFFSKGKARNLRIDAKKTKATGITQYMSGTNKMLPTCFNVSPINKKEKIHQSEKPVSLWEQVIDYVTKEGEIILDHFAGSGSVGQAAINKGRRCILIELIKENVQKIAERLNLRVFDCCFA